MLACHECVNDSMLINCQSQLTVSRFCSNGDSLHGGRSNGSFAHRLLLTGAIAHTLTIAHIISLRKRHLRILKYLASLIEMVLNFFLISLPRVLQPKFVGAGVKFCCVLAYTWRTIYVTELLTVSVSLIVVSS